LRLNLKNKELGKKHLKLPIIFFILSAGSLLHITLDAVLTEGTMPFYPVSACLISLDLISKVQFPEGIILVGIDAVLLFFWIFWMEFKLKISEYF